jgi:GntR family transcriptional regulator
MDILEIIAEGPGTKQNVVRDICDRIRSLIVNGELEPGTRLPAEVDLAKALGVSRNTVRDALNILHQEGTIQRKHGIGTFITAQLLLPNRLDVNLGVTELIKSLGSEPGVGEIHIQKLFADEYWADLLNVPLDAALLDIERVRLADGKPVVYSRDVFAEELLQSGKGPSALPELATFLQTDLSIYKIFEERVGVAVDYGVVTVKPAKADAHLAQKLAVSDGDLLMFLTQVDYDADGHPILASHEYHIADVYTFTVYRKR